MTKLEDCLEGIINIFHQYSVQVGHADMLSKGELGQLITQEMPNILKQCKDQSSIDQIFQDLDRDRDGAVSFEEFVNLLSTLIVKAHENLYRPC